MTNKPTVPTVILVTGHPATGKTTLSKKLAAEFKLPLIGKDIIKETLADALQNPSDALPAHAWSGRLSQATWKLLYQQTEELIRADVTHIVEANFDPKFANPQWQTLAQKYDFVPLQIRCEAAPQTILDRYADRVKDGSRHAVHVDAVPNPDFAQLIQTHLGWIEIGGARLSFDNSIRNRRNIDDLIKPVLDILNGSFTNREYAL
ncbi:MAG: AAA family ATPase [Chloroflexota bacterium]